MIYQPMSFKQCTRCKEWKPATKQYFDRNRGKYCKFGLHHYCKPCRFDFHSEKYDETAKAKKSAYNKGYRAKNGDHLRAESKRYHKENAERLAEYRANKAEHRTQNTLRWQKNNPDKVRILNHRRAAKRKNLPDKFYIADWRHALNYWDNKCAICGRAPDETMTLAADHWIPLDLPHCPGTVPTNILPLCHGRQGGRGGCNNSKSFLDPVDWLIRKFGEQEAQNILQRIQLYFASLKD